MLTVGNEPWDVLVWWVESFGSHGVFVLEGVTSCAFVAGEDAVNVGDVGFGGAGFGDIIVGGGSSVVFYTFDEWESIRDLVEGASFKSVVGAFDWSVLAGESPFGA